MSIDIKIQNCNNIDSGNITVKKNILNIMYAVNGTGKSTITEAILNVIKDKSDNGNLINTLTPFKYIGTENTPEILGIEELNSVMVFNENYIENNLYKPEELVNGSFDIFINDASYQQGMVEIENVIDNIKQLFIQHKDLEDIINDFNTLSASFGKPTASGIHGSSQLAKALKSGNKVENIPDELKEYSAYIRLDNNYKWIKWQLDGKDFLNVSDNCPYCVSEIKEIKEKIEKVSTVYKSKDIENLNKIIEVFSSLKLYFTDSTQEMIDSFIKNIAGYTNDQVAYLREIKEQADRLKKKLNQAKFMSFNSFKDVDKVIDELEKYKINLSLYNHFNASKTLDKVNIINNSIDKILEKAGSLQGKVFLQKKHIKNLVKENKQNINSFLKNAGYNYSVDLPNDTNGRYQLKLEHIDSDGIIQDPKTHLSFGEKNAFALVLFMFDVLKKNPDLVILDDPISSFDKNKKYAIIDMLFRRNNSLKDKTVLMLTHDIDPIIDMVHHHRDRFSIPNTSFLYNENGALTEHTIERNHLLTFIEVNQQNLSSAVDRVIQIVYLRRHYEILNNENLEYHIISSLLHKKCVPEKKDTSGFIELTLDEIEEGTAEIKKHISDFNYAYIHTLLINDNYLKKLYNDADNNYDKLHYFRIIMDDKDESLASDIVGKFINEAFHIENNYIYQLNPRVFQLVPQYVIDECDRVLTSIQIK